MTAQPDGTDSSALPPELVAAFRVFLGRRPDPTRQHVYENVHTLNRMLERSPEFRASPRAVKTPLGWPLGQVFVSKPARVLYCPIGKNACTFLKTEVARTAQPEHMAFLARDIHFITDNVRTGLQLSDHSRQEVAALIAAPDYFKFAVLRDPLDRLLSAYIEKLVIGRTAPANIFHTRSIVAPVQQAQGIDTPDFARGITFRDFVEGIAAANPATLDPHWRPQADYLVGIDYDRFFRIDELDALMTILEERAGIPLGRQPRNVTGSGKGEAVENAMDLPPATIAAGPRIGKASFVDDAILARIKAIYARDYDLLTRREEQRA